MSTFGKILTIIFGIYMMVCGLFCMFNPALTYSMVGFLVGFTMLFDAFSRFFVWIAEKDYGFSDTWMLISAIISGILGVLVLGSDALQIGVEYFIVYYVAIWLVVTGVIIVVRSFQLRNLLKQMSTLDLTKYWLLPLIVGILMAVFGAVSVAHPDVMSQTLGVMIGLGVFINGVNMIVLATTAFAVDSRLKEIQNQLEDLERAAIDQQQKQQQNQQQDKQQNS